MIVLPHVGLWCTGAILGCTGLYHRPVQPRRWRRRELQRVRGWPPYPVEQLG